MGLSPEALVNLRGVARVLREVEAGRKPDGWHPFDGEIGWDVAFAFKMAGSPYPFAWAEVHETLDAAVRSDELVIQSFDHWLRGGPDGVRAHCPEPTRPQVIAVMDRVSIRGARDLVSGGGDSPERAVALEQECVELVVHLDAMGGGRGPRALAILNEVGRRSGVTGWEQCKARLQELFEAGAA